MAPGSGQERTEEVMEAYKDYESLIQRISEIAAERDLLTDEVGDLRRKLAGGATLGDPLMRLRGRVLCRKETRLAAIDREADEIEVEINALRDRFPEMEVPFVEEGYQKRLLRGRLQAKRLELGRLKVLLRHSTGAVLAARVQRAREVGDEVTHYEALIHRIEEARPAEVGQP